MRRGNWLNLLILVFHLLDNCKRHFRVKHSTIIGQSALAWATPWLGPSRFFFKWEENKYFSPYAYWFIFKSDLLNPNCVEKNSYVILLFLKSYFFDEQSKFLNVRFYWNKPKQTQTKRLNNDSFTNENLNKFKCHRSKVSRRKEKKVCC